MFRLDENALREDDAYQAAYDLAMAHREHMEALYRGFYDAAVTDLKSRFAWLGADRGYPPVDIPQPIHQTTP